jgi:hypothetical protein
MATSSRLLIKNGLSPQEASVASLCQASPHQRLNLCTIISSPRKFAECLYCDVNQSPILPILSRFIKSSVICSFYSRTNHIHTFIQSYIHTLILSHIHTFIYTQHIRNINSYMVASVTHSLVLSYPFSSIFTHGASSE